MGRSRTPRAGLARRRSTWVQVAALCSLVLAQSASRAGWASPVAWTAAARRPAFAPAALFARGWRPAALGARRPAARALGGEAPHAGQAAATLEEETRRLRETQEVLIQEMRLLREALRPRGAPAGAFLSELPQPPPPERPAAERPAPAPAPAEAQAATAAEPARPAAPPLPAPPLRPVAAAPRAVAPAEGPAPGSTAVKLISAGHASGNAADFFLDDDQIPVSIGPAARRGLNVVVVDPNAGRVLSARCYDIWGNPIEENRRLAKDLKSLPDGHVVLAALKDSGMENIDSSALAALRECGSTLEGRLTEREAYALIGAKGADEPIAERRSDRMIMLETTLPFALRSRVSPPPAAAWPSRPQGGEPPRPGPPASASPGPAARPPGPARPPAPGSPGGRPGGPNPERPVAMIEEIQERIRAKRLAQTPGAQAQQS